MVEPNDDVVVYFSDPSLSKGGGCFDEVSKIMSDDIHYDPDKTWMIDSHVEVKHRFGMCVFDLHFYNNKSVCIYDYKVRRPNASNLSDIQFLKQALSTLGWSRLYPYHSEVDRNEDFWKSLWETGMIEYDKFESMYSR
tara:strand:+ start:202 stop:615 length:414 start_codon:yes stop_codon:yes gene_type:complete